MSNAPDSDGMNPADAPEAATADSLEAELAEARAKADEHWNSYLRAVAENDNLRKRAQRDVEAAHRFAIERFAAELVDVRDSLELGVASGPAAEKSSRPTL